MPAGCSNFLNVLSLNPLLRFRCHKENNLLAAGATLPHGEEKRRKLIACNFNLLFFHVHSILKHPVLCGAKQVWGVGSGLGVRVERDCLRREREDIRAVRKAAGRETEKKTHVRRLRYKHVPHSCEPGQGSWTVLL